MTRVEKHLLIIVPYICHSGDVWTEDSGEVNTEREGERECNVSSFLNPCSSSSRSHPPHLRHTIICSTSNTLVNVQSHQHITPRSSPKPCAELITFITMATTI